MRIIPLLLFSLLATAAVTAERDSPLPDILARHAAAVGGPIEALEVKLRIEEPGFVVDAVYVAERSGRMRIDVYQEGERVFTEALDGRGGWQWPAGGEPTDLSAAGRAALRRGIVANLYGLHERPALGYELEYRGAVEVDGRGYWVVASQSPQGFLELFYVNRESALVERKRETSALHPDLDPAETTTVTLLSDFRRHEGRALAHATDKLDTQTGERLQKVTITGVTINHELIDDRFTAGFTAGSG